MPESNPKKDEPKVNKICAKCGDEINPDSHVCLACGHEHKDEKKE